MNRKTYQKPTIEVVRMQSEGICAGSYEAIPVDGNSGITINNPGGISTRKLDEPSDIWSNDDAAFDY